jgi:hypothetical protein
LKAEITQALVERVPLTPSHSATNTDTELRGFMLLVGKTAKRYYAQAVAAGRQVRVKVGDRPTLTAREAREGARQKLAPRCDRAPIRTGRSGRHGPRASRYARRSACT